MSNKQTDEFNEQQEEIRQERRSCPECNGRGGSVVNCHDFERCDVCLGEG